MVNYQYIQRYILEFLGIRFSKKKKKIRCIAKLKSGKKCSRLVTKPRICCTQHNTLLLKNKYILNSHLKKFVYSFLTMCHLYQSFKIVKKKRKKKLKYIYYKNHAYLQWV